MNARHLARGAFLIAVLVAAPAAAAEAGADAQGTLVWVDAVTRQPLYQSFTVIGRLVARQRGVVAARTRGPVAEMRVHIGDRVRKGDVLAVIDRSRLAWRRDLAEAQVKEQQASLANAEARQAVAEARVATAEAQHALAQQELVRFQNLRKSAAFSQARHDDQRQQVAVALSKVDEAKAEVHEALSLIDQSQARILRAKANLKLARDDLALARVRASFDGVVTLRHTEAGAYLEVGDEVVTLVNDRDLEVEADVPYNRIAGLDAGVEVSIRLDDGSRHRAVVRAVGVEENPKTRTRQVRFAPTFGAAAKKLADGQSVALDLPIGPKRDVVSVHKDAIIREAAGAVVFVVVDGIARKRPVELGEAFGARFEVLAGLAPGDQVVVRGNERLRPGQSVRFKGAS
ncbi:MAG: efflux RND transporter periplasmic adaptor subunit [Proteobacteria bacterium]|nr:efflux RND transporter periplasmic adaptor subunit [Pseudomonadota bacterium]